jgi:hypothetical protein
MKVTIASPVQAVMGWNIDITVEAEAKEKIASVNIQVNDFTEVDKTLNPPLDSWELGLQQKGRYPGDNKVDVLVRDQDGNETRAERNWS